MRRKRDHVIGKPRPALPIALDRTADAIGRLDHDLARGQKADRAGRREVGGIVSFRHSTLPIQPSW